MFSLTREERKVILFLITVALLGATVDFLAKKLSPVKTFASIGRQIGRLNINTADKAQLMSIPGIGEKIAVRIIEYRKNSKNFDSPEELKKIKGINGYRYEKIKDYFVIK